MEAHPNTLSAAVFDPAGARLLYSTMFGDLNFSSGGEAYATAVAVDRNRLLLSGRPDQVRQIADDRRRHSAYQWSYGRQWSGSGSLGAASSRSSIPSLPAVGRPLAYATYLGGQAASMNDYISGIAIDSASNAYVVGYTNSKDFPVTQGAFQTVCGLNGQTCVAAHVTKLNPSASAILWSTYLGDAKADGSDPVYSTGPIQLDGAGNVYIIGRTGGVPGFPMVQSR